MIIRLLLLLFCLFLIVYLLSRTITRIIERWRVITDQLNHPKQITSKLVKCQECGTFVPENEAYRDQDCYYCAKHRK